MASHRVYRYTSIGRPLDPQFPSNRTVLILMPVAAVIGAVLALMDGLGSAETAGQAARFALIVFGAWALARELDPDDNPAAFIGMAIALYAAVTVSNPGILIVFATLGLVRIVNRSTGLKARMSDSIIVMLLTFWVIYSTQSPLFGTVAAIAFVLDGSLKDPLRHQWVFGLICLGGTIVYMIDHDLGLVHLAAPDSLYAWLSLLFLAIFALDTLLLKKVHSVADVGGTRLDLGRVRGGMAVGLLAALQALDRPDQVVVIVCAIAGIGIGIAFRKGFKVPAKG